MVLSILSCHLLLLWVVECGIDCEVLSSRFRLLLCRMKVKIRVALLKFDVVW